MTKLYLKSQWTFRTFEGRCYLTSEMSHFVIGVGLEYEKILTALHDGVTSEDLTDEEFDQIEYLTNCDFISVDRPHPTSPIWELSNVSFHTVQEQIRHTTFAVVDTTENKVGETLKQTLLKAGLMESTTPRITFLVSDSYLDLPECKTTALPVIVNRMRLSLGPLIFPWGKHAKEVVLANQKFEHTEPQGQHLPKPGYELPPAYDALQRAWIGVTILQFIGMNRLRFSSNFVEYDMASGEFKLWPVK